MAYPYKESDLIDLMISGASRVVINNTLDDEKLRNFFDITDELVMRCSNPMDIRRFNEFGGNMYLAGVNEKIGDICRLAITILFHVIV